MIPLNCYRWSVLAFFSFLTVPALVQGAPESEPNNFFSERNIFPAGVTSVEGFLEPGDFFEDGFEVPHPEEGDYALYVKLGTTDPDSLIMEQGELPPIYNGTANFEEINSLFEGDVDFFSYEGLTPNTPFVAIIDNTIIGPGPDTTLGWLFEPSPFSVILADDDSSPLGDGLADAISGTTDEFGILHLAVSGFDDFDFDGFGDFEGECDDEVCFEEGDVDFVSFTGLNPGEFFLAEISSGNFDSVLGLFDNSGVLRADNDDGGDGLLSVLGGLVPADGTVNLAVSGFADFFFEGFHGESGDYTLDITAAPLGEEGISFEDFVILPTDIDESGGFVFDDVEVIDGMPILLDPHIAIGYAYAIDGGGITFGSVQLPALISDTEFLLSFLDETGALVEFLLSAGDVFDFTTVIAGGVTEFQVNGIDIAEMLDSTNPIAFVTAVTTIGSGSVSITQSPIAVPEPSTFVGMLALLLPAVSVRRRKLALGIRRGRRR